MTLQIIQEECRMGLQHCGLPTTGHEIECGGILHIPLH